MHWQVSRVFGSHLVALGQFLVINRHTFDQPPILVFELSLGSRSAFVEFKFITLLVVLSLGGKGFDAVLLYLLVKGLNKVKEGEKLQAKVGSACHLGGLTLPCLSLCIF